MLLKGPIGHKIISLGLALIVSDKNTCAGLGSAFPIGLISIKFPNPCAP